MHRGGVIDFEGCSGVAIVLGISQGFGGVIWKFGNLEMDSASSPRVWKWGWRSLCLRSLVLALALPALALLALVLTHFVLAHKSYFLSLYFDIHENRISRNFEFSSSWDWIAIPHEYFTFNLQIARTQFTLLTKFHFQTYQIHFQIVKLSNCQICGELAESMKISR